MAWTRLTFRQPRIRTRRWAWASIASVRSTPMIRPSGPIACSARGNLGPVSQPISTTVFPGPEPERRDGLAPLGLLREAEHFHVHDPRLGHARSTGQMGGVLLPGGRRRRRYLLRRPSRRPHAQQAHHARLWHERPGTAVRPRCTVVGCARKWNSTSSGSNGSKPSSSSPTSPTSAAITRGRQFGPVPEIRCGQAFRLPRRRSITNALPPPARATNMAPAAIRMGSELPTLPPTPALTRPLTIG